MYFSVQNVHSPYEMPPSYEASDYPAMWDNTYANMLAILDSATCNVTDALKRVGLWDSTLVLWTADNGGITLGNNYPLRGHKHDPWEGGSRVTAFLTGGFLPAHLRGTSTGQKFVHIADWYPTFVALAGADPTDPAVLSGQIHDIDGVDVWPVLTGTNLTQPRRYTPLSEVSVIDVGDANEGEGEGEGGDGEVWWKLITLAGQSNYYFPNQTAVPSTNASSACLAGAQEDPPQPGRTDALVDGCPVCNATQPCLYNILSDPFETINLAPSHPEVVERLARKVAEFEPYYVTGRLTDEELERR